MSGARKADHRDATPRVRPGRTRSQPTTSTVEDRNARERDEWRRAGELASGIDRAMIALALARSRVRHAAAEGVASYD